MAEASPVPGTSAVDETKKKTFRDPNGEIEEQKAYDKLMSRSYPDFMCSVHRIPEVFFCHPQVMSSRKCQGQLKPPEETVPVYLSGTEESHVKGDIAEMRVADNIEYLLKYWCSEKCPAFIITNYKFEQFCNKSIDLSAEDASEDGEHDVVIIHYKYGIIFIQIKSCENNPNQSINDAMHQLRKDSDFFTKNFSDLNLNVGITEIMALPNMSKENLDTLMKKFEKIISQNKLDTKLKKNMTKQEFDAEMEKLQNKIKLINTCLQENNLPNLETKEVDKSEKQKKHRLIAWWNHVKSNKGFSSEKDFKIVIERYIGFKSTAHIPHPDMKHLNTQNSDMRKKGHAVSRHGNIAMSIILTRYQLAVLNCSVPRLVIRGQYGTGKTIVLILKARKLLRDSERVCVISLSQSPLIHLIEASVKHDMESKYFPNLEVRSFGSQGLQGLVSYIREKTLSGQRWNVLIDEFPTITTTDYPLKDAITNFPEYSVFWVICSRERQRDLDSHLKEIFLPFKEVVFDVMLRCPSSLHNVFPRSQTNTGDLDIPYPGGILNSPTCSVPRKLAVSRYLHSIGLSTPQTRQAAPGCEVVNTNKWSDLSVHDKVFSNTKRWFHTQLTTLGVPLVRGSDVINFSIKDEQDVKERKCNRALYTNKVPDDVHDAVLAAVFKDKELQDTVFSIYLRHNLTGQLPSGRPKSKDASHLDEYLKNIGFVDGCDHWYNIIFVDSSEIEKPETYTFVQSLGIPLVTPCQQKDIFEDNTVFITGDFQGYQKRNSIIFIDSKSTKRIISNETKHQSTCEGPRPVSINHADHTGELRNCVECEGELTRILDQLGIVRKPESENASGPISGSTQQKVDESQNILQLGKNPRNALSFSDLVIMDDREGSPSAEDLFKRCGVPVIDKLNHLEPEDAFGSDDEVLYTKPNLFQGLERKVVIVIKDDKPRFRSSLVKGNTVDFIELAISRCSSQLIVLNA